MNAGIWTSEPGRRNPQLTQGCQRAYVVVIDILDFGGLGIYCFFFLRAPLASLEIPGLYTLIGIGRPSSGSVTRLQKRVQHFARSYSSPVSYPCTLGAPVCHMACQPSCRLCKRVLTDRVSWFGFLPKTPHNNTGCTPRCTSGCTAPLMACVSTIIFLLIKHTIRRIGSVLIAHPGDKVVQLSTLGGRSSIKTLDMVGLA